MVFKNLCGLVLWTNVVKHWRVYDNHLFLQATISLSLMDLSLLVLACLNFFFLILHHAVFYLACLNLDVVFYVNVVIVCSV